MASKDLLVLLLDVGQHMQPYLPLLHRMVFNVLNCKLLSRPHHEVAVVLFGTEDTRHKMYNSADPLTYHHVIVTRPLQNLASHLDLEPFAFAEDPPLQPSTSGARSDAVAAAGADLDADELPQAEAALLARVEAAGLACRDAAAVCSRAVRLFGRPGPKADWADGLVVALDVVASTMWERFEGRVSSKLGQRRVMLVSNLLGESEPFEDDFRATLVETCNSKKILLEVACLDHYVPPSPPQAAAAGPADRGAAAAAVVQGGDPLAALPPDLAAARRRNLEQLHLLKSEMAPAAFRHLRQPAELLCLFACKEVSLQSSNAVFMLSPPALDGEDDDGLPPPLTVNVKLYKKTRRAVVEGFKAVLGASRPAAAAAGPSGGDDGGGGADAGAAAGSGDGGASDHGFVQEVEYEDPTSGQKFTRDDFLVWGYLYGKQAVPITQYNEKYGDDRDEEVCKFREKDFSLVGFVDAGSVPHHRFVDEPHVVLGSSARDAVAIASLALVLKQRNRAGVVRFIVRRNHPQLGLLTPHLSDSPDVPHALLLSPLPFAEDIRTYTFSTFRNEQEARELPGRLAAARGEEPPQPRSPQRRPPPPERRGSGRLLSQLGSAGTGGLALGRPAEEPDLRFERLQPDAEQQDAALDLVRTLDLGPSALPGSGGGGVPHPEALAPDYTANPSLQRVYALVTSRALDPRAQLPDPEDDPLVELVLQPHGRYWQEGAQEAIRRAEEKLRTWGGGASPAAKRARREEGGGGEGAAAGGKAEGAAGAAAVFAAGAAGGTSAGRVTRVGELTAVEDFRAMVAQGRDSASDAMKQLQGLVRTLVGRSIGDQLYNKAIECVQALRDGCIATGRAGAFNRFLLELAGWCKSQDRALFMSRLTARGVTLITAKDLQGHSTVGGVASELFEDDGGAVAAAAARQFLEQHSGNSEDEEMDATLPAVAHDEEFEDMD